MKGQFAEIEFKYLNALLDARTYEGCTVPNPLWERENKTVEAKAGAPPTSAPLSIAELVTVDNGEFDVVQITDALVLQRLQLSSLPAQVRVRNFAFLQQAEDNAVSDEDVDEVDCKRRRIDMYSATLEAVELDSAYPSGFSAHISYSGAKRIVDSDILLPDEAKREEVIEVINELPPFDLIFGNTVARARLLKPRWTRHL